MRTAQDLKVNDKVTRGGIKLIVRKIEKDEYKNGTPCLKISCSSLNSEKIDSTIFLKLTTKI